ncbi:acyl-CoA dehydrogenase family protein [Natronorubrum sp. A-ect3]|uniref:acyl-CoA dehydrogenase family protein n=1 Tax=Natronorubrum sp. A-ect3 TaxID=3242698 RepID=UPI00359E93C8
MVTVATDTVELSAQQQLVRESIRDICSEFDDEYWREKDRAGDYPDEFVTTLGEHGWLGVLIPEEHGGAGMGTAEVVVMMEEIAASGGGFAAAQAIHGGIYNSVPIVRHGSDELKERLLPDVAAGDVAIQSLGLTEPNAGSDSTSIETVAEKHDDEYVINGQKIWTSRVDASDYLLVVARTTPKSEVEKRTRGISMFLVDVQDALEAATLEMKSIPKTASNAVHAYELWFDELHVPADNLIGERGNGFYHLLDGLNEERLVIAAECLGLGELAIQKGVEYANERVVFDRPIGQNQAIQHPLAKAYAEIQAAKQLTYNAATAVEGESGTAVGAQANMAKYLAAEAAFTAADAAVQAHGGFGVAREYDVERYFREARLTRLVPITQELVLNYIGENVLGLPRSY